jgi:hypothetical protein
MFSMITNIYNMKTKGPTLMELFTATEKNENSFLTTRGVRCVHHGWYGTHRYDSQVLATHTRQHGCVDILHCCSDPCRARMVLSVGGSFAYFARNARCTVTTDLHVWYASTQNDFSPGAAIFSLYTLASPSGRNVNYDGKQITVEKIFELFLLSVQVS